MTILLSPNNNNNNNGEKKKNYQLVLTQLRRNMFGKSFEHRRARRVIKSSEESPFRVLIRH